jgi:hypothetical protein
MKDKANVNTAFLFVHPSSFLLHPFAVLCGSASLRFKSELQRYMEISK